MEGTILAAFATLFQIKPMLFLMLGTALGIMVGSIPGLTASMLIALTLPLTFYMNSVDAITLLIGEYVGGISGGFIAAILLRMPGTPASIVTTFDGYPMAKKGLGQRALGLAILSSFCGGIISWFFLAGLSPTLADLALKFGPWEYFTLVLTALVMLATLSQGAMAKGLLAGSLGMMLALPGMDSSIGQLRLTFGWDRLNGGFQLLPVLIGTFAISQIIKDVISIDQKIEKVTVAGRGLAVRFRDLRTYGGNIFRSSCIGAWVGLLPGIGANIAALMAYTTTKQLSKTPEVFGKGHEGGVVAAETANNASIGGALIPMITMGIPGSVTEAILIGALVIHNLQPGPLLFTSNPEIAYGIIVAYLVANMIMLVMMLVAIKWIAKLIYVPKAYLLTSIIVFCVIGSFALANNFFDVWVMLAFGVIGYLLDLAKVPLGPFVIGFVLTPIAEEQLRAGLMMSGGNIFDIFNRPFAVVFLMTSVLTLLWPLFQEFRNRRKSS